MHFAEAEQLYRELEARLIDGELSEDEFIAQAAELRVMDAAGRRWMLSGRTGRWYVHDGQRWLAAEPPEEPEEAEAEPPSEEPEAAPTLVAPAESLDVAPEPDLQPAREARPAGGPGRLLIVGAVLLLLVACLAAGGAATWVLFLRGGDEPTPTAQAAVVEVDAVATFTPRPPTATYTPTFTPTPSRTPTPTITPIPSDTPVPTDTPLVLPSPTEPAPTATVPPTPAPTNTPSPTLTATKASTAGASPTYVVKRGDTLWGIATRYGITVQALAQANGLRTDAVLHAGQKLIIPVPGTTPVTPTRTPTGKPATTATAARTATPTKAGPTATPKPAGTPVPTVAPTAKPSALKGKIAFTLWNTYELKYDLYVANIDGSGRNMLGTGFRQPQFRPDGNLLAVSGEGHENLEHLVTMDPSGRSMTEVSQHTEDSYPTWRADGAIVAFSSAAYGDGQERLGIVNDMLGKGWEWILIDKTEIRGHYPYWMADGRVVYQGCDFLGDQSACGLYWVGAGGGTYHRLTANRGDTAPAGSGTRVAFMSDRDGNWEVYTINMDGSGLKRLTNNAAQDGLPTWSPDGRSIAFVSHRDGAWAIWVMNADGSSQRKLFNLGGGYGSGASDWITERISWAP